MVKPIYIPERGDIVWLTFDPTLGHEQAGRRPAFVMTRKAYNKRTGLMIACPITKKEKGYSGEATIKGTAVIGAALVDQLQSCDWKARRATFIEVAPIGVLDNVLERLFGLLS